MKIQNDEDKTTIEVELSEVNDKMLSFAAQYGVQVRLVLSSSCMMAEILDEDWTCKFIDDVLVPKMGEQITRHARKTTSFHFTDKSIATMFYMKFK